MISHTSILTRNYSTDLHLGTNNFLTIILGELMDESMIVVHIEILHVIIDSGQVKDFPRHQEVPTKLLKDRFFSQSSNNLTIKYGQQVSGLKTSPVVGFRKRGKEVESRLSDYEDLKSSKQKNLKVIDENKETIDDGIKLGFNYRRKKRRIKNQTRTVQDTVVGDLEPYYNPLQTLNRCLKISKSNTSSRTLHEKPR